MAIGKRQEGESHHADSCALCKQFYEGKPECANCPVKLRTGEWHCRLSPWPYTSLEAWQDEKTIAANYDSPDFKSAAAVMLQFLKDLRDGKATKWDKEEA